MEVDVKEFKQCDLDIDKLKEYLPTTIKNLFGFVVLNVSFESEVLYISCETNCDYYKVFKSIEKWVRTDNFIHKAVLYRYHPERSVPDVKVFTYTEVNITNVLFKAIDQKDHILNQNQNHE